MADKQFLQFKGIQKRFSKNEVLKGVDLDISAGDIYGIIGLSGCGKTTLLNILIGFLKSNAGKIYYHGEDILRKPHTIRQTFGFGTQDGSFYTQLSAQENLNYFGRLYGLKPDAIAKRSASLLSLVGLTNAKDTLGGHLSKGMQRRLDIACALIHDPQVLILDEPTEDLDPALRKDIIALIKQINSHGTTIIITSHLLKDLESLCTRIAILHEGKILHTGSPRQLSDRIFKYDEIHIETYPGNYRQLANRIGKKNISKVKATAHGIVIYTPKAEVVIRSVLNSIALSNEKLIDIAINKPSLEEVFESMTRRSDRGV